MTNHKNEPSKFHTVQAERDLEANWDVDLAKKLEDYLLKICSGEITGTEDDNSQSPVNFAEAALLLQGSIQVYSRKVEYLHNLVLHALEFLSQKRQQEQPEHASAEPEQSGPADVHEGHGQFWGLDDIPVEPRNCLDASTSKDASFYHFVKPPANLIVLEGDCLDTSGDSGELESYLLATSDLYRDFILLDPCDAAALNDFLKEDEAEKGHNCPYRGSSARKSFQSPTGRSGRKSSLGKNQNANLNQSPMADCSFRDNSKAGVDPSAYDNFEDGGAGFDNHDGYYEPQDLGTSDAGADSDDDDDDPWKPLNPHEPGNLKVKPFKKVRASKRNGLNSIKKTSTSTLFPLAKLHGTISPELAKIWETRHSKDERHGNSQSSPPLYEKLRESLINGRDNTFTFGTVDNDEENEYDNGAADFGQNDDEMPENMFMDEDLPHHEKHDGVGMEYDTTEAFEQGEPSSQASLEDLCRAHLDALLANIAENEKQTELAARVSSWKQKIEHDLEEQESRPPFDIHEYGERILDKLSLEEDKENAMSFADVVKGQGKPDVARSFSALLQLVNNGAVDLHRSVKGGESLCYTASNPFHVRLLNADNRRNRIQFRLSKKRLKSPIRKISNKDKNDNVSTQSSPIASSSHGKFSAARAGKNGGIRCTPEGKRRRRSKFVEAVDLNSAR